MRNLTGLSMLLLVVRSVTGKQLTYRNWVKMDHIGGFSNISTIVC